MMLEMDQLVARLNALCLRLHRYAERYELLQDSRAVFTTTYALITHVIATELPKRKWNDREFIVSLAEAFAGRYIDTLDAYDLGKSPGSAWEQAFRAAASTRTSVLEDLICAMAVHIMHDLPLALVDIGFQDGSPNQHIADYHQMNDVLASAVDQIFTTIARRYNPILADLEILGRKNEDLLTDYGISLSRAAAWYNACRLRSGDSAEAAAAIVKSPEVFIHDVLHPPAFSAAIALRAFRWVMSLWRRWPTPSVRANTQPVQTQANREYYFHIGAGHWHGTFTFWMTSIKAFLKDRLPLKERMVSVAIAAIMGLLRKAPIDSRMYAFLDQNANGVAFNLIRIVTYGVTLYVSREVYALSPDGQGVFVETKQRFGPIPLMLNFRTRYPATVEGTGFHTQYNIPLLGTTWLGDYHVADTGTHIDSRVSCSWAVAEEHIDKQS